MKKNRSSRKILLALAGFLVLTLIFFGGSLIMFDYFLEQPAASQRPQNSPQSDSQKVEAPPAGELTLAEEAIPTYDSYNFLSEQEKLAYKKIVAGLLDYRSKIPVRDVDTNQIERVLMAIDNDHPEIFWVEELAYYFNEYTDEVSQVQVNYDYDQSQKEARQQEIDMAYGEYLQGLNQDMDTYEIVKATYEYVVRNTVYGENEDDQNIYSVFGKKESVCAGYAKAMKYLLDRQKIDCSYVAGFVDVQGAHAWNLVLIDGEYYYLDATWGEFDGGNPQENISYDYFCVTTKTLELSHEIDDSLVVYPEFTARAANYFVREKKLYDLADEREKMRLKNDLLTAGGIEGKYFHFAVVDNSMLDLAEMLMDEVLGNYTFFVDEKLLTFTVTF